MTDPDRPQWRDALDAANATRAAIVQARQDLRDGTPIEDVLAYPELRHIPVRKVVMWIYRWGNARTNRMLGELEIWPNRACGRLTEHQRHEIGRITRG